MSDPISASICLTFDNMGNAKAIQDGEATGPDDREPGLARGYPKVLTLLEELDLQATFFIEGWNAVHHPERVLELTRRGHEVALHGWMHEPFARLGAEQVATRINRGDRALRSIGVQPLGFRAPGGARGPHLETVLTTLGYRYDSSTPCGRKPNSRTPDCSSCTQRRDGGGLNPAQLRATGRVRPPFRLSDRWAEETPPGVEHPERATGSTKPRYVRTSVRRIAHVR
jgi:peptidoglycan/xylan/chitin deacetylase (PgdA/CDA1 family)